MKIVFQREFRSAELYDREFGGIRRFMPVSHEHPGLMRVLHVGRNDDAACFYYMMELGDGQAGGQSFDPATLGAHANIPALFRLNEIILKACDQSERRRYASAAELHADLGRLREVLARGQA